MLIKSFYIATTTRRNTFFLFTSVDVRSFFFQRWRLFFVPNFITPSRLGVPRNTRKAVYIGIRRLKLPYSFQKWKRDSTLYVYRLNVNRASHCAHRLSRYTPENVDSKYLLAHKMNLCHCRDRRQNYVTINKLKALCDIISVRDDLHLHK